MAAILGLIVWTCLCTGVIDCGLALYIIEKIEHVIDTKTIRAVRRSVIDTITGTTKRRNAYEEDKYDGPFDGRIVWITGASQGVGREIAIAVSINERPYAVILTARDKVKLTHVRDEIKAACRRQSKDVPIILICCIDLLNPVGIVSSELDKCLASIPEGTQRGVETCICGVGVSQRASVVETENDVDSRMVELCCLSAMKCIKLHNVIGKMLDVGRGCIVVLNSMAGVVPSPGQASYSMAKHALRGWTETLRTEVRGKGIQVTSLCPGPLKIKRESVGFSQETSNHRLVMGPLLKEMITVPESGGTILSMIKNMFITL